MPLRGPTCKIAIFQAGLKLPSWTDCGNISFLKYFRVKNCFWLRKLFQIQNILDQTECFTKSKSQCEIAYTSKIGSECLIEC